MRGLIFALVLCYSGLQAEVRELISFDELTSLIDSDTLVLLDIDDTIIDVPTTLGTAIHSSDISQRLRDRVAIDRVVRMLARVRVNFYSETELQPVEPCTSQIVADLQNKGITVLGLTARSKKRAGFKYFDFVTNDNVAAVGVDFNRSKIPSSIVKSGKETAEYFFANNIIYTDRTPKGLALEAFLKDSNWKPKRVLFVDDQPRHAKSVNEAMERANIPCLSMYYLRADHNHPPFDPVIGAIQLRAFLTGNALLTEEEASRIKAANPDRDADYYFKPLIDWIHQE